MNLIDKQIQFRYKGNRIVKGRIVYVSGKILSVCLSKDYKGKNDFWEAGEIKHFNISEIKNIQPEEINSILNQP